MMECLAPVGEQRESAGRKGILAPEGKGNSYMRMKLGREDKTEETESRAVVVNSMGDG